MVIAKSAYKPPTPVDPAKPDKWHRADGSLSAVGKSLRDRTLAYLEFAAIDLAYSQVRDYLVDQYPDDYRKPGQTHGTYGEPCLFNRDIKVIVGELVKEDLVIE